MTVLAPCTAGLPNDSAAGPERKATKANLNTLSSCAAAPVANAPRTPAPATKAAANPRSFMVRPPNLNFYCCGALMRHVRLAMSVPDADGTVHAMRGQYAAHHGRSVPS